MIDVIIQSNRNSTYHILICYKLSTMLILIITLTLTCVFSDQMVPIPAQAYGITTGKPDGRLHIEAFLDYLCPDSKNSFFALKSAISRLNPDKVSYRVSYQSIPLNFHYHAFKIHTAVQFVHRQTDAQTAYNLAQYFFNHQGQFTEQLLEDYPIKNVLDSLAAVVADQSHVDFKTLRKQLEEGSQTEIDNLNHWKYSVGTHGVSSAPMFAANSVIVDGAEDYDEDKWFEFINHYGGVDG